MDAISALPKGGGMIAASCAALGVSRASLHRRARPIVQRLFCKFSRGVSFVSGDRTITPPL